VKSSGELLPQANEKEQQWLSRLLQLLNKDQLDKEDFISWAAFHAQSQPPETYPKANIALMPLFYENTNSTTMIKHATTIAKDTIQHLNPGQTPVITMDQPLYSLVKQIQWTWLENLGEENYVVMLGGLHIEMAVLHMLGEWLDGSGWSMALIEAGVATSGKAGALISSSHIKQTHYTHQVAVAALHVLRRAAYQSYMELEDSEEPTKAQHYPQFHSWSSHGARVVYVAESNFSLYIDTLDQLMPWFFALDHVNYAHWLPVHIQDMVALKETHRTVLDEFQKGNFVVQQSTHSFLLIALDQSHEQTNKYIKGEGGLTENTAALRRWMVAGPEVARVVAEFEESMGGEESSDIKDIMDDTVVKSIRSKKSNLPLFHNPPEKAHSKSQFQTAALKKDCQLFSKLYIACQSRDDGLEQFFAHKNQAEPPSLSSQGRLQMGTKSDLLPCLEAVGTSVPRKKTNTAQTFEEYAESNFIPYVKSQLEDVQRLDVIWDQYPANSLKVQAQEGCGLGSRRCVSGKTAIPRNWAGFLCNNQNKTELFCFLSEKLSEINVGRKELYTTHLDHVLTVHHSDKISEEVFDKLECFVVLLFSKTSAASWVNETQQTLFAKGARALENNPRALMQHVKRAALQAGYVWSQMLLPQPELPSPAVWGWEQTEHGWTPKWTILPEASKACYELIHSTLCAC
uniref:Uncharacterized protein n=1 Tax=Latimeria chalumnae TaxID=7897 RepID=H3APT8_LATCH